MDAIGVDGTRGGWLAVRLTDGRFAEAGVFETFDDVVQAFPQATAIGVDIPIGLPVKGRRAADEQAREKIGKRRNSVFFTPPRPALEEPDFDQAVEIARSVGASVSQQSYALRTRIFEVERFATNQRVVEVHPEVSFWAMNERKPLLYPKRTWNGLTSRLALLRRHGVELPDALKHVDKAAADDVVDAAAAAWSAFRVARGTAWSLPDPPEVGPAGRAMAIWY